MKQMDRPIVVIGLSRCGLDFPSNAEFGECRDCKAELGWNSGIPRDLPKLCVACFASLAERSPTTLVILPSGQAAVILRHDVAVGGIN